MKGKISLLLALVALVAAGALLFKSVRKAGESPDFPDGMHWLCLSCGQGFDTSRDTFAAWVKDHPDQPLECSKCKRPTTVVAKKCDLPGCGRYYTDRNLVIDGKVCCPVCRRPIP